MIYVPLYLYFLYGGSVFTIEKKTFKAQFSKVMKNVSYILSAEQTIMTRNFSPELQKNPFQSKVLNNSLNFVCCCMNKEYMEEISEKLCVKIFADKEYVKKEHFISE